MTGLHDEVPGYRLIRITEPATEKQALADVAAAQARDRYPTTVMAGPQFGTAMEREHGGWEILSLNVNVPQDARNELEEHFEILAYRKREAGERDARAFQGAFARLEREALDEVSVAGRRYRIIRAERCIRSGPEGPEPPRKSDPDPAHEEDPVRGFVIDTVNSTTLATGVLTIDLLGSVYSQTAVPADVYQDSNRALHSHPGGLLLPAAFIAAELNHGMWGPARNGTSPSPSAARRSLLWYLRVWAPYELHLNEEQQALYAAAADTFEDSRDYDLAVCGRRFRLARVERLIRIGPDGPEGPRGSDYDPEPPPRVHEQQVREQSIAKDAHDSQSGDHKRLNALFQAEEDRIRRRDQGGTT